VEALLPNDPAPLLYGRGNTVIAEPALRLSADGPRIPLRFENLQPGVYFVRLVGRVAQPDIPHIRPPLYLHLRVNDGLNGETNEYRMLVKYDNFLQEAGRIFFNALYPTNNLDAELFVGHDSQVELLVHRVEFYDALAGTDRRAYKTSANTFTAEEWAYVRQTVDGLKGTDPNTPVPGGGVLFDTITWRWGNNNNVYYVNDSLTAGNCSTCPA